MTEDQTEYEPLDNSEIERDMNQLPDVVANALLDWRKATIARETWEARTILSSRASGMAMSWEQARLAVKASDEWVRLSTAEASHEAEHARLYERLMATKKTAGIRTAY